MSISEYLAYIRGYIKACKLKKDTIDYPYIITMGNLLICLNGLGSSLYTIELEYSAPYNVATTLNIIDSIVDEGADENLCFNQHIYNMVIVIWNRLHNIIFDESQFKRISSSEDIPDFKASDNSTRGIYYYDEQPTEEFIHYNYYNMVPTSKSDTYYVDVIFDATTNTHILRYTVLKKKPKCNIVIYRRALNLIGV